MATYTTPEELHATMDRLVAQLAQNERFKGKIGGADTSVCFIVTDLKTAYTLRFQRGQASGSPGDPGSTTLGVNLSSKVLDELLSGKRDGESAYMYGALTLRGSEYTAESLLYYMPDIIAAYRAASA